MSALTESPKAPADRRRRVHRIQSGRALLTRCRCGCSFGFELGSFSTTLDATGLLTLARSVDKALEQHEAGASGKLYLPVGEGPALLVLEDHELAGLQAVLRRALAWLRRLPAPVAVSQEPALVH